MVGQGQPPAVRSSGSLGLAQGDLADDGAQGQTG